MYLDEFPELSRARLVRARSRGVAIRDRDRAVAIAFLADGTLLPGDTLVRFEVTQGEEPARRLTDALAATGARSLWFYGGDAVTRRAALALDLQLRPVGAAFVHRADSAPARRVVFRAPSQRDRTTLAELQRDHAAAFATPLAEVAEVDRDAVGIVFSQPLDPPWTELRVVVHAPYRGQGHGRALFAAAAERLATAGRRACAATESPAGRERSALEAAGFRLVDYYFSAAPKR